MSSRVLGLKRPAQDTTPDGMSLTYFVVLPNVQK